LHRSDDFAKEVKLIEAKSNLTLKDEELIAVDIERVVVVAVSRASMPVSHFPLLCNEAKFSFDDQVSLQLIPNPAFHRQMK
jgi:hypothetical protein